MNKSQVIHTGLSSQESQLQLLFPENVPDPTDKQIKEIREVARFLRDHGCWTCWRTVAQMSISSAAHSNDPALEDACIASSAL